MPNTLSKEVAEQRHPCYTKNQPLWQFYADHYEGGALYMSKVNPLPLGLVSPQQSPKDITLGSASKNQGARLYLWQYPLERSDKYAHRLARAIYINIVAPVVDFYCATIGKQENIIIDNKTEDLADFMADADRQGGSLLQVMAKARTAAAVRGHVFLLVDQPATETPIYTQKDAQDAKLRPYICQILPEDMLNWRLDENGQPVEILFRRHLEPTSGVLDAAEQTCSHEIRYWSKTEWKVYQKQKPDDDLYTETAQGNHQLGRVPLEVLYFRKQAPFESDSLLKDAAKMGQLATNWCSALDETFENAMFPIPVWYGKESPNDAGIGNTTIVHCNPDRQEKLEYVSAKVDTFEAAWDAFYKLLQLANKHMGMVPKAITTDKVDKQSGISKEWDFFEAEKILNAMATNEQEAVKGILNLAAKWRNNTAGEYTGTVQYAQKYDLSTAQQDIEDLISLQSAGVPNSARKEMMRRVVAKKLPSLPENIRKEINDDIDDLEELPFGAAMVPDIGGTSQLKKDTTSEAGTPPAAAKKPAPAKGGKSAAA